MRLVGLLAFFHDRRSLLNTGPITRSGICRSTKRAAPDYGMRPEHVPASRKAVEFAISGLFVVGGTSLARGVLRMIPEKVIGPVFNKLRLSWKNLSKPTKRKGLADFKMIVDERE